MSKKCILYERECIDCCECDVCDLDESKICDNCGRCIDTSGEFRSIKVMEFWKNKDKKDQQEDDKKQ